MPIRISTFPSCLIALLVLCAGPAPVVAAPKLYDVEIIIFSQNSRSDQGEAWHQPDAEAGRAQGVSPQNRFTELSSSRYRLKPVRYSLQQGGEYTVLYHRAWRQLAYSPSRAVDYPVQAMSNDSRHSVEGTIRLVRGRYLHLDMDLLMMDTATQPPGQHADDPGNRPAYRLNEKRRIKRSDLHYFDHPRFGVLALITPVSAPKPDAEEQTGADAAPVTESPPRSPDDSAGQASP